MVFHPLDIEHKREALRAFLTKSPSYLSHFCRETAADMQNFTRRGVNDNASFTFNTVLNYMIWPTQGQNSCVWPEYIMVVIVAHW